MTSLLGRHARGIHLQFVRGDWHETVHEGEVVGVYIAHDHYYLLVVDHEHRLREINANIVITPRDAAGPLR